MYKCGWQGCEKAYGTLNHLNAHVTMQSHGQKRTPEGNCTLVQAALCPYTPQLTYGRLTICVQNSRRSVKNGSSERRRRTHNARPKTSGKDSIKPQRQQQWHLDNSLCFKSMAPLGMMVHHRVPVVMLHRRVLVVTRHHRVPAVMRHHRVLVVMLHNKSVNCRRPWGMHLPEE